MLTPEDLKAIWRRFEQGYVDHDDFKPRLRADIYALLQEVQRLRASEWVRQGMALGSGEFHVVWEPDSRPWWRRLIDWASERLWVWGLR